MSLTVTRKISSELAAELRGPEGLEESSGKNDWVVIEQREIPEEQQIATAADLRAGIAQLESGYSAHTAWTGKCPASYGGAAGHRAVSYRLTFYVHRSKDVDPEVEVTLGGAVLALTGPTPGLLLKSKSWIVQKNKTQQLGWRAHLNLFTGTWEIAFDSSGSKVLNPTLLPKIEHDDGFAYLIGDAVTGSFRAAGTAEVDVYTATISQQVGTKWEGGLYATAWWPAGADRANQKSVSEELFLPECVVEKIQECVETIEDLIAGGKDPFGDAGNDDGSGDGSDVVVLNRKVRLAVDDCSGEVLGEIDEEPAQ